MATPKKDRFVIRDNQLNPIFQSTTGLHPMAGYVSASRLQMFNSHITQAPPVVGATPRRIFTGMEHEFGKFTFSVKVPHDAHVLKIIKRYPRTIDIDDIKENPEFIVIYEYETTDIHGNEMMELDYIECKSYHSLHQTFGFMYKYIDTIDEYIPKDTYLAKSPSIDENDEYCYGLEANVAMMSIPQIIEDGVVASESFCERLKTTAIEKYVVNFGKNRFPLNLYGDDNQYKIFPDIGDTVNDDGILIALRNYDERHAPMTMNRAALKKPDYSYDLKYHAPAGAKIIDVNIHHDKRIRGAIRGLTMRTPIGMYGQPEKYLTAKNKYYQKIVDTYRKISHDRHGGLRMSHRLHRLVVEAMGEISSSVEYDRMSRTYRGAPIDEWRIEITIAYDVVPTVGYKLTGTHGDKAVIVAKWKDEDMPVDTEGNRAELITDGHSTIKRMNIARVYEQYLNAASRHVTNNVIKMVNDGASISAISEYVIPYYEMISPRMIPLVTKGKKLTSEHIESIVQGGIYIWMPTDHEISIGVAIADIRNDKRYAPHIGPVTYRGASGNMVTTINPILIGSMYTMLLEKTGSNVAAVASAKLNHFGIPAKLTRADRNTAPLRAQPTRFGESELRLFVATAGSKATAELVRRTNNPAMRRHAQETLLTHGTPANIKNLVDGDEFKHAKGRIQSLTTHVGECDGWCFSVNQPKGRK